MCSKLLTLLPYCRCGVHHAKDLCNIFPSLKYTHQPPISDTFLLPAISTESKIALLPLQGTLDMRGNRPERWASKNCMDTFSTCKGTRFSVIWGLGGAARTFLALDGRTRMEQVGTNHRHNGKISR